MAKKQGFEAQMKKLENIRDELETNELSLDKAITLYEEGVKVLRVCREQLNTYEARIEELSGIDDQGKDDKNDD